MCGSGVRRAIEKGGVCACVRVWTLCKEERVLLPSEGTGEDIRGLREAVAVCWGPVLELANKEAGRVFMNLSCSLCM